jgi:hypothetical protein
LVGLSDFLSFPAASRFMPLSRQLNQAFSVHSTRWLGCQIFFVSELHLEIHDSLKPTDSSTLCSLNSLVGLSDFLCIWAASRYSWLSQANWFKHSLFTQLVGWVVRFSLYLSCI